MLRRLALLGAAVTSAVTVMGCGSSGPAVTSSPAASGPGIRATAPPWVPEDRHLVARLRQLGLPASGAETFHIHALLNISVNGNPVQVPANVGIDDAHHLESTLHTHDGTGVIHMEAPRPFAYTLGDFFAVWGVRFTRDQLGSLRAHGDRQLRVYVNGHSVSDPANYVMKNRDNIAVGFGTDGSFSHTPGTAMLSLVESGSLTCGPSSKKGETTCSAPKKRATTKVKTTP